MLTSIELENYRGFKRYQLRGLSRVNLLVGKNNCGKTSVLEAVHLLASGGDPYVLLAAARQRGEMLVTVEGGEGVPRRVSPTVSHFFFGHEFGLGSCFRLSSGDGLGALTFCVIRRSELKDQNELFADVPEVGSGLAFRVDGARHSLARRGFPVSEDGAIPQTQIYAQRRFQQPERDEVLPVQFIAPDSLEPRSMSEMWNKVIIDGRGTEVTQALKILEPGLTNIYFLGGQFAGRSGILAAFEGRQRPLPLGSSGDGMRHLLGLAISLIQATNGVLLVDEIDTGLHYSIMGSMWHLVAEAAKRSNVQVFATTHSLDCVRGLAWLCENHPELGQEVSLQKIHPALDHAVALKAENIVIAAEQEIEVR